MRPLSHVQDGFAPRLAALYAGLFIMAGIQLPFFPVWLKAKGLDPQMIGVVLAAPIVARLIAVPLVARAADRRDALRAAIIVASCLAVAGYTLVGLAEGARRDPDRLCAGLAGAHAGNAIGGNLCAQGPHRARPRLWAGAAVGLGGLYSRHLRWQALPPTRSPRAI